MADEWPPPADEASVWREFTPLGTYEPVKARRVALWGREAWVAQFDGEWRVWCTDCRAFRGLDVLGKPFNGHAAGIRLPDGAIVTLQPGDDGPAPTRLDRFIDLMRVRW